MQRKAQLNILIVIGLILVIVTVWACGWNLWSNSRERFLLLEVAAAYSILGWLWSGQLRNLFASGASRARWIAWTTLVVCIPQLMMSYATLLFVVHSSRLSVSPQELTRFFTGVWKILMPFMMAAITGLITGKRIDESFPISRLYP